MSDWRSDVLKFWFGLKPEQWWRGPPELDDLIRDRFLDLWKEADPALQPQLQQARDGLRRLRDAPGTAKVGG